MGTTATTRPTGGPPTDEQPAGVDTPLRHQRSWWRRPAVLDMWVVLLFIAAAIWLLHGLWPDPAARAMALNPEDQILIEWFLADGTRLLLGEHGLVSDRLNVPDGMNMLVNATGITLVFLLAPVTLTLGAPVSFAVITVGNIAATAAAFYLLFARTLAVHRAAAAVGGAFCGFAPAMVSQSNSHWHMTSLWLVPAIVWSVVRLLRAAEGHDHRRAVTSGLWLAGLVVMQYFLGLEVLYLTALTLALLTVAYLLLRPRWARQVLPGFLTGMAVAVGTATALLAYPLWVQLTGPGSVPNGPFPPHYYSADLASWPAFSPLSIAGPQRNAELATGPAEYNTFLGWPLLLLAIACVVWLRDRVLVLAAGAVALVMAVLSLGPDLVLNRERPGIPLPFTALVDVPVIDGALPQRYAMATIPLIAVMLALTLDRARRLPTPARIAAPVTVAVALLPLTPTPLPTEPRDPVPAFITQEHWRDCVDPGGVLVPVPLPTPPRPEPMRWAAAANAEFALPEGFFIGPYGAEGRASMGTAPRPTSRLLAEVAITGQVPDIDDAARRQAEADLAYWQAQCVVLGPGQPYGAQLGDVLQQLLGVGEQVADSTIWRT